MTNYNTDTYEIKREIINFTDNLSNDLSFVQTHLVQDVIYGMAASKSMLVSDISRSLNEPIKLINTIERVCRGLAKYDLSSLSDKCNQILKPLFPDKPIIIGDDSDIIKSYGYAFEDLDRVSDGSKKGRPIEKGYHVCEMVALTKKEKQPISIYSKIYSTKTNGFVSATQETIDSITYTQSLFSQGTYVLDRGYDNIKYFKQLIDHEDDFVIRLKENRKVKIGSKSMRIKELVKRRKGKYGLSFEGEYETIELKISHVKVELNNFKSKELKVVIVYGFNDKQPMVLVTNKEIRNKEDVIEVVKLYLMRWRVEETFRFKKQEYGYENIRVRTLQAMNNMNILVNSLMNIYAKISESINGKLLGIKIIERAKALRANIKFWYYQIADGIFEILKNDRVGIKKYCHREIEKYKQLSLKL